MLEGRLHVEESTPNVKAFAATADPKELLELLQQRGSKEQIVQNYNNPEYKAFYHKSDLLRRAFLAAMEADTDFGFAVARILVNKGAQAKTAGAKGDNEA